MKNIHQRWWADDKEENKKMPKNVGATSIAVGRVLALHSSQSMFNFVIPDYPQTQQKRFLIL